MSFAENYIAVGVAQEEGAKPCVVMPPPAFAKREWVGLTDEEIGVPSEPIQPGEAVLFARVIEALLKEKNT